MASFAQSSHQLPAYYSYSTLENARYSVDQPPRPDHVNDDRAFVINREGRATILAVFDGHDGNKASSFVDDYMYKLFNSDDTLNQLEYSDVHTVLTNAFLDTEQAFFKQLQPLIEEKELIQRTIPKVRGFLVVHLMLLVFRTLVLIKHSCLIQTRSQDFKK